MYTCLSLWKWYNKNWNFRIAICDTCPCGQRKGFRLVFSESKIGNQKSEMIETTVRLKATVTGLVQGVNFRWFIQRRASELELTGYVRNQASGSVEFVAEGSRASLERLLDAARVGPPSASVENVQAEWNSPKQEFGRFEIRF